ncbi:MAG TPA: HAD family phosphatase [Bacteroidota bacterium]|nr:HAD family phosphatase [Bacteroidota bacterium]
MIIFDLGRVLVNIDFDAFPRSLGIDPRHPDPQEKSATEKLAFQYETGKLSTNVFFEKLSEIFHGRYTREQLIVAWNAIIVDENSPMIPIVDAAQKRYRTAILSNTSPTHFEKTYTSTAIIKRFSTYYLSYRLGMAKPDSRIYDYIIQDVGTDPSRIVFIDDVAENITASRDSGITSILFENVPTLKNELLLMGILG